MSSAAETRTAADPPARADRTWNAVAAFLADPATHGLGGPVRRIDTHAAAVFLAGPLAWKIKRPVRFPFLDFSTLALRERACRREIDVDRPIAPAIYRRVVAITREPDGRLAIGGTGEPVEWAVEMNRFDEDATLDRRVGTEPLAAAFVDALAVAVAAAEARAPARDAAAWFADVRGYLEQNRTALAERPDLFPSARAERLHRLSLERLADIADLVAERGRLGRVRLGHGDLHTANIAVIDGVPQLFDAVEFDDAIATGDVLYDVAFLVMDLDARGDRPAARRLLDRWLIETVRGEVRRAPAAEPATVLVAEIAALSALPVWLSLRAALRAKIAAATARGVAGRARIAQEDLARRYFAAACDFVEPVRPHLVAIGGLSGSGKSTLARALAPDLAPAPGALVLRSDEIRKLVAGVAETARLGTEHYTREASDRVYRLLCAAAAAGLAAGRSVVIDAVALAPAERTRFEAIAAVAEADFTGLWLEVSPAVAAARVDDRRGDASDADRAVVAMQTALDPGEIGWAKISADGAAETVLAAALAALGTTRGVRARSADRVR